MMENTRDSIAKRQGLVYVIIGILVFGSIWGLLEATLGGFLHMIIFPNKGAIMGGIGIAVMGSALAIYRKPEMLLGIGIIAAAFKLLDVWIFSVPLGSVHIINPAMAIIFESLAFSLVASFMMKKIAKSVSTSIGVGALVGIISAVAYVYFAMYVTNSPLFERMGVSSIGGFIAGNGVVQAVFFGILLPLGYLAGQKLATKNLPALDGRSLPRYATSAAVVVFCWGISAIAIIAGL